MFCRPSGTGGDEEITIRAGNLPRSVEVHVPTGFPQPLPAIIAFHGYGGLATEMGSHTELSKKADEVGFVGIYPQGWGREWAVPGNPPAGALEATDHELVTELLDRLAAAGCVDADRIYVAGHSQGGGMASAVGCEFADRLAGVAIVSGEFFELPCQPSRPIPVVIFHALDDPILPYGGGSVAGTPSSFPKVLPPETMAAGWADRDGCDAGSRTQTLKAGIVRLLWQGCSKPVAFYRLPTGGHDWPGSTFFPGSNRDIDADDVLWTFFTEAAT